MLHTSYFTKSTTKDDTSKISTQNFVLVHDYASLRGGAKGSVSPCMYVLTMGLQNLETAMELIFLKTLVLPYRKVDTLKNKPTQKTTTLLKIILCHSIHEYKGHLDSLNNLRKKDVSFMEKVRHDATFKIKKNFNMSGYLIG